MNYDNNILYLKNSLQSYCREESKWFFFPVRREPSSYLPFVEKVEWSGANNQQKVKMHHSRGKSIICNNQHQNPIIKRKKKKLIRKKSSYLDFTSHRFHQQPLEDIYFENMQIMPSVIPFSSHQPLYNRNTLLSICTQSTQKNSNSH